MKTKHTPGPWQVNGSWLNIETGNRHTAVESVLPGGFGMVASLEHSFTRESEEANARLIAAAPELLEALKELVNDGECYCADNVASKETCRHCKARAAIAKAQGE